MFDAGVRGSTLPISDTRQRANGARRSDRYTDSPSLLSERWRAFAWFNRNNRLAVSRCSTTLYGLTLLTRRESLAVVTITQAESPSACAARSSPTKARRCRSTTTPRASSLMTEAERLSTSVTLSCSSMRMHNGLNVDGTARVLACPLAPRTLTCRGLTVEANASPVAVTPTEPSLPTLSETPINPEFSVRG